MPYAPAISIEHVSDATRAMLPLQLESQELKVSWPCVAICCVVCGRHIVGACCFALLGNCPSSRRSPVLIAGVIGFLSSQQAARMDALEQNPVLIAYLQVRLRNGADCTPLLVRLNLRPDPVCEISKETRQTAARLERPTKTLVFASE